MNHQNQPTRLRNRTNLQSFTLVYIEVLESIASLLGLFTFWEPGSRGEEPPDLGELTLSKESCEIDFVLFFIESRDDENKPDDENSPDPDPAPVRRFVNRFLIT